jgi:hypothetical protein
MNYFGTVFVLLRDRKEFLEEIHHSVKLRSKISSLMLSCYASKLHDPGSEALAARESAWKFR